MTRGPIIESVIRPMLTPEDFRQKLEELPAVERRMTIWEKLAARKAQRLQEREEKKTKELREQEKALIRKKEIEQRNQHTFELASQFPVKEYLEILRDKIAPKQKVNEFGPMEGLIAYSLIYGKGFKTITVGYRGTGEYEGGSSGLGGSHTPRRQIMLPIEEAQRVFYVLGVVLKPEKGMAVLRDEKRANINPLRWGINFESPQYMSFSNNWSYFWQHRYDDLPGDTRPKEVREAERQQKQQEDWEVERRHREQRDLLQESYTPDGGFRVNTPEGVQQFAQALTDFYVRVRKK